MIGSSSMIHADATDVLTLPEAEQPFHRATARTTESRTKQNAVAGFLSCAVETRAVLGLTILDDPVQRAFACRRRTLLKKTAPPDRAPSRSPVHTRGAAPCALPLRLSEKRLCTIRVLALTLRRRSR